MDPRYKKSVVNDAFKTNEYDVMKRSGVIDLLQQTSGYSAFVADPKPNKENYDYSFWTRSTIPWKLECEHKSPPATRQDASLLYSMQFTNKDHLETIGASGGGIWIVCVCALGMGWLGAICSFGISILFFHIAVLFVIIISVPQAISLINSQIALFDQDIAKLETFTNVDLSSCGDSLGKLDVIQIKDDFTTAKELLGSALGLLIWALVCCLSNFCLPLFCVCLSIVCKDGPPSCSPGSLRCGCHHLKPDYYARYIAASFKET